MIAMREWIDRTRRVVADAAGRLRPSYPPVALEVDRGEASIVRLKRSARGKPVLEAQAVRPLNVEAVPPSIFEAPAGSPSELTDRFRELFEASGTRPGRVSLVLPDNVAKVSLLTLPERPERGGRSRCSSCSRAGWSSSDWSRPWRRSACAPG